MITIYSLERSRACRPRTVAEEGDRYAPLLLDEEDRIVWDECWPENAFALTDLDEFSGTYDVVSEKARILNNRQEAMGTVVWIFSPHPVPLLAA